MLVYDRTASIPCQGAYFWTLVLRLAGQRRSSFCTYLLRVWLQTQTASHLLVIDISNGITARLGLLLSVA